MKTYLRHIPLGTSLPYDNPHAVSVSFPTIADVIGYEENDPLVRNALQSGYPRFFRNKLVDMLCQHVRQHFDLSDEVEIFPFPSSYSLSLLEKHFSTTFSVVELYGLFFLTLKADSSLIVDLRTFVRRIGIFLSSRKAEEVLFQQGLIPKLYNEERVEAANAGLLLIDSLQKAYCISSPESVFLSNCGMNAFYAVFRALQMREQTPERTTILQLGNVYLDSYDILRNYSRRMVLWHVQDFAAIETLIEDNKHEISAICTEVPTNPLLECVDLPRLYALCRKYDIALVVDTSMASAYTLNVLEHCDVVTESLSKFANGQGDLLMGAVIVNPQSAIGYSMMQSIQQHLIVPYIADIQRIDISIADYEERMFHLSVKTKQVIDYLQQSPAVKEVYSVLHPSSKANFEKMCAYPQALPGVVSVVFNKPLAYYYDILALPKGPSFGASFTLAMPYVYLAHYDLVTSQDGRKQLQEMGLHPELLRISVGTEPVEAILSVFKNAGI